MELAPILDNIERLLRASGLSADFVSRESGHPDAIRNLRRRVRGELKGGITVQVVGDIASKLGVTANQLMEPREKVRVQRIPGLRGQLTAHLEWLDTERGRVIEQLEALEAAEIVARKGRKRKNR